MSLPWYTLLGYWLCEKTGHLSKRAGWIFDRHYHQECRLCNRIISKPLILVEENEHE